MPSSLKLPSLLPPPLPVLALKAIATLLSATKIMLTPLQRDTTILASLKVLLLLLLSQTHLYPANRMILLRPVIDLATSLPEALQWFPCHSEKKTKSSQWLSAPYVFRVYYSLPSAWSCLPFFSLSFCSSTCLLPAFHTHTHACLLFSLRLIHNLFPV